MTMTKFYRFILLSTLSLAASAAFAADPAFVSAYDPWQMDAPAIAPAETELASTDISALTEEVTIKAEGRKITVNGAEDAELEVFNIAGVKVASYAIDSPAKTITLSVTRGVYILRVGKVTRKVNIL